MTDDRFTDAMVAQEARLLVEAEATQRAVPAPTQRHPGLTIDDAYRIQSAGIGMRLQAGARLIGRKVGLTSRAMQEMLGVDQPDFGVVLDSMLVSAHEPLPAHRLIAPRVEAEIAFVLARPVAGADATADDVLAATSHVCAALEIIDSRVADWKITIADTIADNASSGLVILGDRVPLDERDLAAEQVTLAVGDRSVSGDGAAVLGHPAEAVAWLARMLAIHGEGIAAGEFVIPGAVAAAVPFSAGEVLRASYSSLGDLEVRVA